MAWLKLFPWLLLASYLWSTAAKVAKEREGKGMNEKVENVQTATEKTAAEKKSRTFRTLADLDEEERREYEEEANTKLEDEAIQYALENRKLEEEAMQMAAAYRKDALEAARNAVESDKVDVRIAGPDQVAKFSRNDELVFSSPASWLKLRGRIGTVCVTGEDRIGKSTLLTHWGRHLSRSTSFRFSIGHDRDSHTKGLWSAVFPADVIGSKYHLNICDSQGLEQLDKVPTGKIFSANVLIPQVLVYMVKDVVQNKQIRDLATYAKLFEQLSSDMSSRFEKTLSPHLIVVILNERAFSKNVDETKYLEEVLSGPAFAEDKALVKKVFSTREAWRLEAWRAPMEMEDRMKNPPYEKNNNDGEAWRRSGLKVLSRVQNSLESRLAGLPDGGPELIEWYRSVFKTVNSKDIGSLVRHSEILQTFNDRRNFLHGWRIPIQLVFALLAMLLGFGGFLGRWLDRVAWGVWLFLCICYIGTSPFVTVPLHGFVPKLCRAQAGDSTMMQYACQEFSAPTAAVLVAAVLGMVTYPLLTTQFMWLLKIVPLPRFLTGRLSNKSVATLLLSVVFAGLGFLGDIAVTNDEDSFHSLVARLTMFVVAVASGTEFAYVSRKNQAGRVAFKTSCDQHSAATRYIEVKTLVQSQVWRDHYRAHRQQDALWRYRAAATWIYSCVCIQAVALLVWAYIIKPNCDAVLGVGVVMNALYLVWHQGAALRRYLRESRKDPVQIWFDSLDDASEPESEPEHDAKLPDFEDETLEEQQIRAEIEAMRRDGDESKRPITSHMRLACYFVVLVACTAEIARRSGLWSL